MSKGYFPSWWDTPITIYNKYTDAETHVVKWNRTVLENCFWKETGNKVTVGETILETNDISCRVPEQENFLESGQWYQIPNDQKSGYFTFNIGDIIVKGSVTDEIDEYKAGSRSTDLLNKYKKLQSCLTIKKVSIDTNTGILTPHYFVKGE